MHNTLMLKLVVQQETTSRSW